MFPAYRRKAVSRSDRIQVIQRDKLQCIQCKCELHLNEKDPTRLQQGGIFHHIIPLIYRGRNDAHNICLICSQCHDRLIHCAPEKKIKYFGMYELFIRKGILVEVINENR